MATQVVTSAEANAQSSIAIHNEYDAPKKRPELPRKDTKFSSASTLVSTSPYAAPVRKDSDGVIARGRSSPIKSATPLRRSSYDQESDPVYKPKPYEQATATPSAGDMPHNGVSGKHIESTPSSGIHRRQVGVPKPRYPPSQQELATALALCEDEKKEKDEEIESLKAQNESLRQEWRETSAHLAQTKATITHTIEDQHFVSVWSELRYRIRGWANQHFSGKLSSFAKWKSNQFVSAELTGLSKYWKSYMKSEEHRPMLIQAYIWTILRVDIFAPTSQAPVKGQASQGVCWAADDQKSLQELTSQLRPGIRNMKNIPKLNPVLEGYVKDYFSWRANTTVLVERKQGANKEKCFDMFIPSIVTKIREIVSPWVTNGESQDQIFGDELKAILRKAIHLDADMWKQKAFWHPSIPHAKAGYSIELDPDSMDVYEEIDRNRTSHEVTLMMSPALVKSGSSSGEGYEYFTTIMKSEVSCRPDRTAIASTASITTPRNAINNRFDESTQ
ncbi:uncharacterized protein BDZ99DRAFT_567987 [Mytilinidion resinicola]|uniref:Uncharacterized protein n=1 Tax=Mytilinidion resinicola TaxID=574789 RepID=A0A6A6YZT8_9PEZI|nr:uncharacterized protein BDZ99DRAFT_567987 [Mytilinidion resinicola]KAF2814351.1 hypothetical protein BDZ99DRAFT_567987 [Mytilinidion resinicola]